MANGCRMPRRGVRSAGSHQLRSRPPSHRDRVGRGHCWVQSVRTSDSECRDCYAIGRRLERQHHQPDSRRVERQHCQPHGRRVERQHHRSDEPASRTTLLPRVGPSRDNPEVARTPFRPHFAMTKQNSMPTAKPATATPSPYRRCNCPRPTDSSRYAPSTTGCCSDRSLSTDPTMSDPFESPSTNRSPVRSEILVVLYADNGDGHLDWTTDPRVSGDDDDITDLEVERLLYRYAE